MSLSARIKSLGWNLTALECEDPRSGETVIVVTASQGEQQITGKAPDYDEALALVAKELAALGYNCRIPLYRTRNDWMLAWGFFFLVAAGIQIGLITFSVGLLHLFTRLHSHIAAPLSTGSLHSLFSIHAGALGESILLFINFVFPKSIASSALIITGTSLSLLIIQAVLFTIANCWKREMLLYWIGVLFGIFFLNSGPMILGAVIIIMIS